MFHEAHNTPHACYVKVAYKMRGGTARGYDESVCTDCTHWLLGRGDSDLVALQIGGLTPFSYVRLKRVNIFLYTFYAYNMIVICSWGQKKA